MKDFMKLRYINILYSKKNIKINNQNTSKDILIFKIMNN